MKDEVPQVENFQLHITAEARDARIICEALDLYMRIHMGQLDNIRQTLHYLNFDPERVDALLADLKRELFPKFVPNASHGIRECPHQPARRAYDIYQAIRHKEAWTRMPGGPKAHGYSVMFDEPFQVTQEPLPEVEASVSILERLAKAAAAPPKKRGKKRR